MTWGHVRVNASNFSLEGQPRFLKYSTTPDGWRVFPLNPESSGWVTFLGGET